MKKGRSLSFLVGTISNVLVMEIGWTDVGSGGYILVSCAHSNTSFKCFKYSPKTIIPHISFILLFYFFFISVISNKLDGGMLSKITKCVAEKYTSPGKFIY